MEKLVRIVQDEPVTDSRLIAKYFHKEHGKVLRRIRQLRSKGCTDGFFIESQYYCEQNKQMFTNFYVTYDGFTMLFMGSDLDDTKMMFVEEFNRIKEQLDREENTPSYLYNSFGKRTKKWVEEEKLRRIQEELLNKQEPLVLFANALLNTESISLRELAGIISQKNKPARMEAMVKVLKSKGYAVPVVDEPPTVK